MMDHARQLTEITLQYMRNNSSHYYVHDLPEWIVDRVNRDPQYSLGFTGWKPASDGLVGQLLVAVHSHRVLAKGGLDDPEVRYYAITVPYGPPVRYLPGEDLPLTYVQLSPALVGANHPTVYRVLGDVLRDGVVRLCKFIIEAEADRKPIEEAPNVEP